VMWGHGTERHFGSGTPHTVKTIFLGLDVLLYDRSPRRDRCCHASTRQQSRYRERNPGEAKEQRHTALAVEHSAQHRTGGHAEVAREVVDSDRGGALPNEGTREDRRLHRQGEAEQEAEESAVDQQGA
jgi:hypothetical protein